MEKLVLDGENAIGYRHRPPDADGFTFVFFNPLSGTVDGWDSRIAPALRAEGHGTLLWDYRGQAGSPIGREVEISAAQIVADAQRLIAAVAPREPIHVGLSIGGYFAIRAHLADAPARGLVLLNTLREDGVRLAWINEATYRAARNGGPRLLRDLFAPLLFAPGWLEANRQAFLLPEPYAPLPVEHPDARLLAAGGTARWDLPYEQLDVPVAVLTGLHDRVFLDREVVDRLAARIPRRHRVDVPGAGHMLSVEAPEEVIAACIEVARQARI